MLPALLLRQYANDHDPGHPDAVLNLDVKALIHCVRLTKRTKHTSVLCFPSEKTESIKHHKTTQPWAQSSRNLAGSKGKLSFERTALVMFQSPAHVNRHNLTVRRTQAVRL